MLKLFFLLLILSITELYATAHNADMDSPSSTRALGLEKDGLCLKLDSAQITEEYIIELMATEKPLKLEISGRLDEPKMELIGRLTEIYSLDFSAATITDANSLRYICNLPKLGHLNTRRNRV